MATKLHTTAQIIPFPGSRLEREMPVKLRELPYEAPYRAPALPDGYEAVECGSGWYHDAAMTEANLSRN